jgi:hypothetical protein
MFKQAFGGVAQLGERTVRIRKVKGSNPSVSTRKATSFNLSLFNYENRMGRYTSILKYLGSNLAQHSQNGLEQF